MGVKLKGVKVRYRFLEITCQKYVYTMYHSSRSVWQRWI